MLLVDCKTHCQHLLFNLDAIAVMMSVMALVMFYYPLLPAPFGHDIC